MFKSLSTDKQHLLSILRKSNCHYWRKRSTDEIKANFYVQKMQVSLYKVARTQAWNVYTSVIFAQWHKSSDDVITKVMKTNSPNHLQVCSQLLKAYVVFVEWVFWHIINTKVNKCFSAME